MLTRASARARARVRETLGRVLRAPSAARRTEAERLQHQLGDLSRQLTELRDAGQRADERLHEALRAWERRQRRDLLTVGDLEAVRSSAAFFRREMDLATVHFAKSDTLAAALAAAPATGLFLEFGVWSGETLRQITAHAPAGTVFGFDSFEGLPEHWRSGFTAGTFAVQELPDVPGAELVVGWFDATLPGFLAAHPGPVAFLHVDADLYSSTVTVLDALADRLRPGTVVLFDEYFNFPGWEEHEHRAWVEFVGRTGLTFEYLGLTADDEQVAVRITDTGRAGLGSGSAEQLGDARQA